MEALKARLAKKKQEQKELLNHANCALSGTGQNKYIKKGDLERLENEQEQKKNGSSEPHSIKRTQDSTNNNVKIIRREKETSDKGKKPLVLPKLEIVRRFRVMGEPIKLFGETDEERLKRLEKVQLEKGTLLFGDGKNQATGTRVSDSIIRKHRDLLFERDTSLNEMVEEEEYIEQFYIPILSDDQVQQENPQQRERKESVELTDEEKKIGEECDEISEYFSKALDEWKQQFLQMTPEMKQQPLNKHNMLIYKECQDNLILFFKFCKHRGLPTDVRKNLLEAISYCKQKNYRSACESLYKITIGTQSWIIGVNGIGIHERASRELLQTKNIHHLMNNESYRAIFKNIYTLMHHIQEMNPTTPSMSM